VFGYRVYGLTLGCDTPLPELARVEGCPAGLQSSVFVRLQGPQGGSPEPLGWFARSAFDNGEPWLLCAKTPHGYLLRFAGLADFLVDAGGNRIVCTRSEADASGLTVRHLLLDHVLPKVLNLRGGQALHGTAVATARGVCAFVGPAGAGKSTLAAAFFTAGHQVVADDCLALEGENQILVLPGYPGIRLWKDTFEAFSIESGGSLPIAHFTSKSRYIGPRNEDGFPTTPLPLLRIYCLDRSPDGPPDGKGAAPLVKEVSPGEALVDLLASSFLLDTTDPQGLARHFRFFTGLVKRVVVRRLRMPDGFSALPAVRQAVLADAEAA
jgi:hypothetical protein